MTDVNVLGLFPEPESQKIYSAAGINRIFSTYTPSGGPGELELMKPVLLALLIASTLVASAWAQLTTQQQAHAALARLDRAIALATPPARHYVERGDVYYQLNDFYRAAEDYSAALKLDDAQDRAYFGRGLAYGRMGLIDEGIADLNVYLVRHPMDSIAYTKRGVRNLWRGHLQEAERDLTRAVELDPNNAEAHDDLGVVHAKHQRLDIAAKHFSTAIELDPSYQKAYHNLAICYLMGGKPEPALKMVNAGLVLQADNRSSLILKAAILEALGRGAEAKEITSHAEFLPEGNWSERSAVGIKK